MKQYKVNVGTSVGNIQVVVSAPSRQLIGYECVLEAVHKEMRKRQAQVARYVLSQAVAPRKGERLSIQGWSK